MNPSTPPSAASPASDAGNLWSSPHGRALPDWRARPLLMGVVNLTPDSFSDGGLFTRPEAVCARVGSMLAEGMDILDLGAESTRPGSSPVSAEEEISRLLPVLRAVRSAFPDLPVSIDTSKATVAGAALKAGADMINDVRGLLGEVAEEDLVRRRAPAAVGGTQPPAPDSPMAQAAANAGCPVILMHSRREARYEDFWAELIADLALSVEIALNAGVPRRQLWIDPGFGFGKNANHNLEVLKHLARLKIFGLPILLGTSRKSTLGKVLGTGVDDRLEGTLATTVWGVAAGARMVRVHEVKPNRRCLQMLAAIEAGIAFEG